MNNPLSLPQGLIPIPPLRMFLLMLFLLLQNTQATPEPPLELPSRITLRAAVLHAPPFALVSSSDNHTLEFSGFQYDLLERLQAFARNDNIQLQFNLTQAPTKYDDALNLVAHDCVPMDGQACDQLDMIVGNFYATPDRAMRVDMSPSWLRSTISTIKYKDKQQQSREYTTLTQAETFNGTVCLKDGTFYAGLVRAKFPLIDYYSCPSHEECVVALKAEKCVLYADDELQLHYREAIDPSVEVTPERFHTQWIVWPLSYRLDPAVTLLLKRWIYAATINGTIDELYFKYFQASLCPVGTAGEHCELPCDPDHGQAGSDGTCLCKSQKWQGDDCSGQVPEDMNSIPTSLKAIAYAMLAFNVIVIIVCLLWLHRCRFSAQVKYSQPFFLRLVLLGCLISSCTIIPLAQEDGGDIDNPPNSCMAIPWLYSVGFSITFGKQ
jgi:hypothetical protein